MAKIAMAVGVLLVVLGLVFFVITGDRFPTALIPTWFGLVIALCGVMANTEDPRRRMLWMHIAVTAGLLGFLGAAIRAVLVLVRTHGGPVAHPEALYDQGLMALICAVFTGLCIRSFIAARRQRSAADAV